MRDDPPMARNAHTGGSATVSLLVLGEDSVERSTRVGEHLRGLGPLRLGAPTEHLGRREHTLLQRLAELAHVVGHAFPGLLPGVAELLAVLLDIGLAGVGELEDVAAVA